MLINTNGEIKFTAGTVRDFPIFQISALLRMVVVQKLVILVQ